MESKGLVLLLAYGVLAVTGFAIVSYIEGPCADLEKRSAKQEDVFEKSQSVCTADLDDEAPTPIFRLEPDFRNIYQPEYVTLEFDLFATGVVDSGSIRLLDTSDQRLLIPAGLAIANWLYCPLREDQTMANFANIRVRFTVKPPNRPF